MIVITFGFGDVFFTIYTVYRRPGESGDLVCQNELGSPFCDTNRGISYLTIYRIFVGDIEVDEYSADGLTIFLFVVVTFIGVVVLLNMLIALVTHSYEGSRRRSDRLFGRARIALLAKGLALERLMFPRSREECFRERCFSVTTRLLSMSMVLFLGYLAATPLYFLANVFFELIVGSTAAFYISVVLAIFVSVYMCVILIMYIWIGWDAQERDTWCGRFLTKRWVFNVCVVRLVKFTALMILGANPWHKKTLQEKFQDCESSRTLQQIVRSSQQSSKEMNAFAQMEAWFVQMEKDRRTEITDMEKKILAMEKRAVERDSKYKASLAERDLKHATGLKAMESRILEALQNSASGSNQ